MFSSYFFLDVSSFFYHCFWPIQSYSSSIFLSSFLSHLSIFLTFWKHCFHFKFLLSSSSFVCLLSCLFCFSVVFPLFCPFLLSIFLTCCKYCFPFLLSFSPWLFLFCLSCFSIVFLFSQVPSFFQHSFFLLNFLPLCCCFYNSSPVVF